MQGRSQNIVRLVMLLGLDQRMTKIENAPHQKKNKKKKIEQEPKMNTSTKRLWTLSLYI